MEKVKAKIKLNKMLMMKSRYLTEEKMMRIEIKVDKK